MRAFDEKYSCWIEQRLFGEGFEAGFGNTRGTMFKHILLPLDGSPLSEHSIPYAAEVARKFGGHIHLLRCMMLPEATVVGMDVTLPTMYADVQRVEKEHLERYLERISREPELNGLVHSTHIPLGAPGQAILDHSEEFKCDLIVMSSHGRSGLSRFVYGSVSEKVLHHARCPVLVVKVSGKEH